MSSRTTWWCAAILLAAGCLPARDTRLGSQADDPIPVDGGEVDAGPVHGGEVDAGEVDAGGGTGGGSATDAGIPDGGWALVTGTAAFTPVAVRVVERVFVGGRTLAVIVTAPEWPCSPPAQTPPAGTEVLVLQVTTQGIDAGIPRGTYSTSEVGVMAFRDRIVLPYSATFDNGAFSIEWSGSPANGVTGTFDLTTPDGGTVAGRFAASYCGVYP